MQRECVCYLLAAKSPGYAVAEEEKKKRSVWSTVLLVLFIVAMGLRLVGSFMKSRAPGGSIDLSTLPRVEVPPPKLELPTMKSWQELEAEAKADLARNPPPAPPPPPEPPRPVEYDKPLVESLTLLQTKKPEAVEEARRMLAHEASADPDGVLTTILASELIRGSGRKNVLAAFEKDRPVNRVHVLERAVNNCSKVETAQAFLDLLGGFHTTGADDALRRLGEHHQAEPMRAAARAALGGR